jgi:hypothetical protein
MEFCATLGEYPFPLAACLLYLIETPKTEQEEIFYSSFTLSLLAYFFYFVLSELFTR